MAKIKAGDLKHGQRFKVEGGIAIASGLVDASGGAVSLVDGRVCYVADWHIVELLEPTPEPYCAEQEKAAEDIFPQKQPWDDPGQGWMLLKGNDRVVFSDGGYDSIVGDWMELCEKDSMTVEGFLKLRHWFRAVRRRVAPTYRPYTEPEMLELLGRSVRRKNKATKHGFLITIVDDGSTMVGHTPVSARQLLRDYEFLDGEACGVRE